MHPRVERLPSPTPDYRWCLARARGARPRRIPLIELAVDPHVVDLLLDEPPATTADRRGMRRATTCRTLRLLHRLGYDVMKVSAVIPWPVGRQVARGQPGAGGGRQWADEHTGPIQTQADFEAFVWPQVADVDFDPVDAAVAALPDGMALIGFCGGVLEFAMDLLGMERFLIATRRDPPLVSAIISHVGRLLHAVFAAYCDIDSVRVLWLGDDLGHKHGPLVSPAFVAEQLAPWYARFAELAHAHGRAFWLHSCGDLRLLMPALAATGLDAKHSFEDGIQPVEQFYDDWHERLGVLGGVDVHLLASGDEAAVTRRVNEILTHVADRGGYACGSGNSITDYVPPENYLALVEAVHRFNGG